MKGKLTDKHKKLYAMKGTLINVWIYLLYTCHIFSVFYSFENIAISPQNRYLWEKTENQPTPPWRPFSPAQAGWPLGKAGRVVAQRHGGRL